MPDTRRSAATPPPTLPTVAGRRASLTTPATPRAWAIGLLLIPPLVFALEYTESISQGPDLAAMSLPIVAVFALLLLIPCNLLVKRVAPRAALTQAELLMVYSMNAVAVYIGGIGFMQNLSPLLIGWRHFATPENHWADWFDDVRSWAVPDPAVIPDYYAGKSSLFTPAHLRGWAGAVAVWTGFLMALLACLYCIATLMRRQWVENERLVFPIVQIPLEITRDGGATPLWGDRLFWAGAGLAAALEALAALHFTALPTLPYLPLKAWGPLEVDQNITTPPWNAVGFLSLAFYPFVIGLTYLVSLDVSFSCWAFYLLNKLELVAAASLGFRDAGAGPALAGMPYTSEQDIGAFVGLALISLWLARRHLAATLRRAFRGDRRTDDADEPLSYRAAWLGLLATALFLVTFGVALGLSLGLSVLFFGLFLLMILSFTRIRAEAGLAWEDGPDGLTHGAILSLGGTQHFTTSELTGLAFLRWFDFGWRAQPQPAQLEAMKMAGASEPRPLNPRHMTAALGVAALVGALASWAVCLGLYYHYGADSARVNTWRTALGHYPFDDLQGWLNGATPTSWPRLAGTGVGVAVVCLLSALRARFVWWPLHPIGYVVGATDPMNALWCPMLVGWLCKSLILRYGGVRTYRQALPFFMGLFLGDYAVSGVLTVISLVTGLPSYRTFPI